MKIIKKILVFLGIILAILAWGWVGELDHHRYIEANLTPQTKIDY